MKRFVCFALTLTLVAAALAAGRLVGNARTDGGFGMKEHWLYLQRAGASGAHVGYTPDDGWYDFATVASGDYCLFDSERYIGDVYVPEGGLVRYDLDRDADFWASGGGYETAHEIGQTFVAIGTHITRLYIDVGNLDRIYVLTLHEGGRGGPQVGPTRSIHRSSTGPIIGYYRHGEMPVTPGQTYYAKLVSDIGAIISVQCAGENQYPYGEAYFDGAPDPELDFRAEFNAERDGLILNHPLLGAGYNGMSGRSLGQTMVATGNYIVAVGALLTYGSEPQPIGTEVSVWEGFYGGPEICPRKSIGGLNDWMHGVGWVLGECPVTPGQQYYVRWTRRYLEQWFIAMYNQGNFWPDGHLWTEENPHTDSDAGAWIIEHTGQDYIDFSHVRATELGAGQVSVKWSTAVACSSQVRWEVAGASAMSALDQTDVSEHEVLVSGVPASGTFEYSVRSWVAGRIESESESYVLPLGEGGTRSFALGPGWSLIGYASDSVPAPSLAECRVSDGAQTRTWDDAVSAGWVQDGLFYYDGASYKLLKTSGGDSDSLASGSGYWVLNESGVPLSLLAP